MKRRVPIYAKVLGWLAVNVVLLALLMLGFLRSEFRMSFDWVLSGGAGDRIAAMGDQLTAELAPLAPSEWSARLQVYEQLHGVTFALFASDGTQVSGSPLDVPGEVKLKLIDKRSPNDRTPPRRPAGSAAKRPTDAPPKPRFLQRAGAPARYWAGIHLDLIPASDGRALTLVMVSNTITAGGLFLDLWPWVLLALAALLLSAMVWMPFVRGLTGSIQQLNQAASSIAQGRFDERVQTQRNDELGELSTSVNAMAAQLGDYVAQQRRITADVAHELCSPIARMQMALGVVEQRASPEQAGYVRKLDAELQHMAKLVEEVLMFSKAATLPAQEAVSEIDLNDLIDDLIAREAANAEVIKQVPSGMKLSTRRSALDRAIGNVLRNAVRYAAQAGPITITATQDSDRTIIRIADVGPGMPAEALPRIFEAFYRPESARGRGTGGSGLGLAITKRCIEACGGKLSATLATPHGFRVEIELPGTRPS